MRDSPRSERFASDMRSCLLRYAGIYAIENIMGVAGSKGQRENVMSKSGHAHVLVMALIRLRVPYIGGRKKATGGEPFALG